MWWSVCRGWENGFAAGRGWSVQRVGELAVGGGFNTIIPTRFVSKDCGLGFISSLCNWIFDFLTHRPQLERMGKYTS